MPYGSIYHSLLSESKSVHCAQCRCDRVVLVREIFLSPKLTLDNFAKTEDC